MFSKVVSLVLVSALLHTSIAAQSQQQSPTQSVSKIQQVLRKAKQKDKAVQVILNTKIDNQRKFSGKVSDISDKGFVITDEKTGQTEQLGYADVREVHQKGWSTGATIGVIVIAGVAIAAVLLAYRLTHLGD